MGVFTILWILSLNILAVDGQCTFQAAFQNTVWHDNTKGTLTFTDTVMTGWSFLTYGQTVNSWDCLDSTNDTVLIMKSTNSFSYSGLTLYAYMCLELKQITEFSYYYYQMQDQEKNAGQERLKFSTSATLTATDLCSTTSSVPTFEYHVLVKSGFEESAAITCPDVLLFTADYTYTATDGSVSCTGLTDSWDVCNNTKEMTFNYTSCSQTIVGSTGGKFWCVASLDDGNGTAAVVAYNQDTTLATGASQFACFVSDGNSASLAPGNCTGQQTPAALPLLANGVTTTGAIITIVTKFVTCVATTISPAEEGLSAGVIAGIVLGVLIFIALIALLIVCCCLHPEILSVILSYLTCSKCRKDNKVEEEKPMVPRAEEARVENVDETAKGLKRQRSNLSRERSNLSNKSKDSLPSPRATSTPVKASPREVSSPMRELTNTSIKSQKVLKRDKSTLVTEDELEPRTKRPFLGLNWTKLMSCYGEKTAREHEGKEEKKEGDKETGFSLSKIMICFPDKKEQETHVEKEEPKPVAEGKKRIPAGPIKSKGSPQASISKKGVVKGGKKGAPEKGKGKTAGLKKEKSTVSVVELTEDDAKSASPDLKREKSTVSIKTLKREKSTMSMKGKLEREKSSVSGVSREQSAVSNGKVTRTGSSASLQSTGKGKEWSFLMCCYGNRKGELPPEEEDTTANGEVPKSPTQKGKGKAASGVIKVKPAPKGKQQAAASKEKKPAKKAGKSESKAKDDTKKGAAKEKVAKQKKAPEKSTEKPPREPSPTKEEKEPSVEEITTKSEKSAKGKAAKKGKPDKEEKKKEEKSPKEKPAKEEKTKTEKDSKEKPTKKEKTEKSPKEKPVAKEKATKEEKQKPEKASEEKKGKVKEGEKPAKEPASPKGKGGKKGKGKDSPNKNGVVPSEAPVETTIDPQKSPKAISRSKTMPVPSKPVREQTASTLDTSKVKLDLHLPDDIESAAKAPSAKVTKTKSKKGGAPKLKKSKTTLVNVSAVEYYANKLSPSRPVSQPSRPLSRSSDFKIPPTVKTKT